MKASLNLTELRSFLGLCKVPCQLVQNFVGIASLLKKKLRNDQPFGFVINDKKLDKMKSVQQKLISYAVVALPYA